MVQDDAARFQSSANVEARRRERVIRFFPAGNKRGFTRGLFSGSTMSNGQLAEGTRIRMNTMKRASENPTRRSS